MAEDPVLCVDFGSTFTKAALVDGGTGRLLATASHRTTSDTDVLDGLDACRTLLARTLPEVAGAEVLACSSAGGGLRIAVVGTEELVTAEAGRRVALSSGGKVVRVLAGGLDAERLAALGEARPDVLLLVGGTDGGNPEVLERDARVLAGASWRGPVVVAGNVDARPAVSRLLQDSGTPYVVADNVVPRIGVLHPEPARQAIRQMFLAHVIGGKHLSARTDFTAVVRGATPDVVLTGVEVLAGTLGADASSTPGTGVVVVDVGGATTDVHSAVPLDPEDAGLSREVVASTPLSRTVEGDLGMRWSALGAWEAAVEAGLLGEDLRSAAVRRTEDPAFLARTGAERREDEQLAAAAATLALRRHAGRSRVVLAPGGTGGADAAGRVVERSGRDLREVGLLVGSGGVLRHAGAATAQRILGRLTGVSPEGWQLPEHPRTVVDVDSVLMAVGLLAERRPEAAAALARSLAPCEDVRG